MALKFFHLFYHKKLDQTSKYENMKDVECVGVKPTHILKENFLFKIYNVEKFNKTYAKFYKKKHSDDFFYYIKIKEKT